MVQEMAYQTGHPFPQCLDALSESALDDWRKRYLSRLKAVGGDAGYVVDKLPLNFQYLGMLATLFPGCKIVHCQRHPLDVGLSIFRQYFPAGVSYANSLQSVADYYCGYHDLMMYWQRSLGDTIFQLQYEALVDNPDGLRTALLEYLEVDEVDAEQQSDGIINTASIWQARQPIYKSSTYKWQHYTQQLAPMAEILDQAGIELEKPNGDLV